MPNVSPLAPPRLWIVWGGTTGVDAGRGVPLQPWLLTKVHCADTQHISGHSCAVPEQAGRGRGGQGPRSPGHHAPVPVLGGPVDWVPDSRDLVSLISPIYTLMTSCGDNTLNMWDHTERIIKLTWFCSFP